MASITTKPAAGPDVDLDNTSEDPTRRAPLVLGGAGLKAVTDKITSIGEDTKALWWWICFLISSSLLVLLLVLIGYLFTTGPGVWGNNIPVAWGFPIINFVYWVGIAHAGTLISAILFCFRQNWRTGINRFSEAMTIFAVVCAGMFPAIHVGRPWFAYWLFPYPNQMSMWPQFRSPLLWDVFAVGTYATVSLLFWYTGLVPDLASMRDKVKSRVGQVVYGIMSFGWNGSARHWHRYEKAYLILAGLATPLVLSVHSVVSFDFAVAQLPGWHTTIFPPYFVAGAIYGGFAMVLTVAMPAREVFNMKHLLTDRHIDNCCKVMLAVGLIVAYGYWSEFFIALYGGHHFEQSVFIFRPLGTYAVLFWLLIFCNIVGPQILWFKWARKNFWCIMFAAMCINFGMWFERFVIIVTSLSHDYLPSSWGIYVPTWVDICMLAGSFGLFFTLFLLFLKFLPISAMAEIKTVMPEGHPHTGPGGTMRPSELRADYQTDEDTRRSSND